MTKLNEKISNGLGNLLYIIFLVALILEFIVYIMGGVLINFILMLILSKKT